MDTRSQLVSLGPEFSRMICGYWRLMEWGMTPEQLLVFMEQHIELGITTVDHADIYGGYQCEQAFGQALRLKPSLRDQMELVSKCGIATTAKPEHALGHYITDCSHIVHSAEQSLTHLHTDYLDLLLIHRPDPLMDADEVAEAFIQLHKSGKVKYFGVSNFTPTQFSLLQSRLPFSLVTNQVEISPLHQPAIMDGTLDACQQLRIKPMAWSCLGGGVYLAIQHSKCYVTNCRPLLTRWVLKASNKWFTLGCCAYLRHRYRLSVPARLNVLKPRGHHFL